MLDYVMLTGVSACIGRQVGRQAGRKADRKAGQEMEGR